MPSFYRVNNNFNTADGTGAAVRGKLNEILTALRTINAGTNDPSGAANVVQFQPHIKTKSFMTYRSLYSRIRLQMFHFILAH